MLENKGFEHTEGYANHEADVYTPDGHYVSVRGENNSPYGWNIWFRHEAGPLEHDPENNIGWAEPETRYAGHMERIKDGQSGFVMFSFYRVHWGGLYQQVDAIPGRKYNFTIACHAWSSNKDDPLKSEGAPGPYYGFPEEAENEALLNFQARVGIDPTGGTNPFADTVVWGEKASSYNAYHDLPNVRAIAQSDRITVFTEHAFLWPFKHCDAYYDSALLSLLPDEPQPKPDVIPPRVQYARKYILLTQDMGADWAEAAARGAAEAKNTIGWSADDAGVGPADRTVIAVNPDTYANPLKPWFDEHYPGIKFSPLNADTPLELEQKLKREVIEPLVPWDVDLAEQIARRCDLPAWPECRWPHRDLDELTHVTVHHIGSDADVIQHSKWYLTKDTGRPAPAYTFWIERNGTILKLLHLDEANWHDHSGNDNRKHLSIGLNGDLTAVPPTDAQLNALVKLVVWAIRNPEMNITVERITGHMDWINTQCPGWDARGTNWKDAFFNRLYDALGIPPVTPNPEPEPKPKHHTFVDLPNNLGGGVHATYMPENWQVLVQSRPSVFKVFSGGDAYKVGQYRDALSQTYPKVVWRKHVSNDGYWVNTGDRLAGARAFLDLYKNEAKMAAQALGVSEEELLTRVDYISGVNELIGHWSSDTIRQVEFAARLSEETEAWAGDLLRIASPAIAVGNPHETEFHLLKDWARRAASRGDLFDYHAYWTANMAGHDFIDEHWAYHAGRWTEMDKVFTADGVYPLYFFGECGVVVSNKYDGTDFCGGQAWRTLPGSWEAYIMQIQKFNDRLRQWNADNGNRALGGTLFTMAAYGWNEFLIGPAEELKLAEWSRMVNG